MRKITDLTQGSIVRNLWIMAVPLISSSFIQMAYSMTDMLWLGHLGSDAVAAVGAAGFFVWLSNALSYMTKTGAEITVSQSIGARDPGRAAVYANHALTLSVLIGLGYAIFILTSADVLIRFFHFDASISSQSAGYLQIVAPGIFFQFNNNTFSGIYNGQGDSKTPFRITAIGLLVNIVLDPLLIYGYGPFPRLGTAGAAIGHRVSPTDRLLFFRLSYIFQPLSFGKNAFIHHPKKETVQADYLFRPACQPAKCFIFHVLSDTRCIGSPLGSYRSSCSKCRFSNRGPFLDDGNRILHSFSCICRSELRSREVRTYSQRLSAYTIYRGQYRT